MAKEVRLSIRAKGLSVCEGTQREMAALMEGWDRAAADHLKTPASKIL